MVTTILLLSVLMAQTGPDAGQVCDRNLYEEFIKTFKPATAELNKLTVELKKAASRENADRVLARFLGNHESYCDDLDASPIWRCNSNICGDKYCRDLFDRHEALLKANGCIYTQGNNPMIVADYGQFADLFGSSLSSSMVAFLQNVEIDQKVNLADDGFLMITRDELAEMLARWDEFIVHAGSFAMKAKAKEFYDFYLGGYLRGMENEEIFFTDIDQCKTRILNGIAANELCPEIKASYKMYVQKHAKTRAGKVVKAFYDLLKRNKFITGHYIETFYKNNEIKKPDWGSVKWPVYRQLQPKKGTFQFAIFRRSCE